MKAQVVVITAACSSVKLAWMTGSGAGFEAPESEQQSKTDGNERNIHRAENEERMIEEVEISCARD